MNTLFDFLTHVKTVEYLIAILSIAGFILYWEVLKPKPFRTLKASVADDLAFVKKRGYKTTLKSIGSLMAAPFVGLPYVVILPFAFMAGLFREAVSGTLNLVRAGTSFEWSPVRAYFSGRRKGKKGKQRNSK
jgi:hypothetical protein